MSEFREIQNDEWISFIKKKNLNTFLLLPGWEKYNQSLGHQTWKIGLYQNKKLSSISLIILIKAKRGRFLFVPHAPYGIESKEELELWFDHLKSMAREQKCFFLRISPFLEKNEEHSSWFSQNGFIKSPIHMHAELTTVVNLSLSEEDIKKNMRKTTRQMIKKGESMVKEGGLIVEFHNEFLEEFHVLYESTAERGKFVPLSRKSLENEYTNLHDDENCFMLSIKHNGKILSWGLIVVSGKRAFYHQGGNELTKDIPSAYMCHWEAMKEAKKRGCISYDFWGVAPLNMPHHPWTGISLFKRGFGGEDVALVPAQDFPISPLYWITWVFEKIRSYRRGFS